MRKKQGLKVRQRTPQPLVALRRLKGKAEKVEISRKGLGSIAPRRVLAIERHRGGHLSPGWSESTSTMH